MASKYGGIPTTQQGSKYGGLPVEQAATSDIPQGYQPPSRAVVGISEAPAQAVEAPLTARQEAIREIAQEIGPIQAGFIAAGKGMYDIGRGLGIIEPAGEVEREAYEALERERPISTFVGEVAGEAAPFAALGPIAGGVRALGARAIPALAGPVGLSARVAGTAGIGALEGGILAGAEEAGFEDTAKAAGFGGLVAGGAELLIPVVGRLGGKIVRKVTGKQPKGSLVRPDGMPTDEMADALEKAGMTWEDMKLDAQDLIAKLEPGTIPEQAARLAGFEQIGAPALKGQISKEFAQRKLEQGLIESGTEAAGEPVRQVFKQQSEAIRGELDSIVDAMGVTGETGEAMKDALSGRRKTLKADRKELYGRLAEEAKEVDTVPVATHDIYNALPDRGTLRDIASLAPNQFKALNDILVEFGIEQGQEAVESAAKRGVTSDPLGLENFESLRKRLGAIERSDQTGAISVVTGPLKRALDNEIDLVTEAMEGAGGKIAETAKAARLSNVALKTEFDEAKITSKLIDSVKRGSTQPKVEVSKAYQKVMNPNEPIENLDRVLTSLKKGGALGAKAIDEMKGRAVLDLIDSAFTSQYRQVSGQRIFGADPFSKQYEKMLPKLEMLFDGDAKALKRIKNVYERAQDIIPPGGAVPKGSAGFFIDALNKIGIYSISLKVPFVREVFEVAQMAGRSATARQQAKKSLDAKPQVKEMAQLISRDYPQIAATLGIAAIIEREEEN